MIMKNTIKTLTIVILTFFASSSVKAQGDDKFELNNKSLDLTFYAGIEVNYTDALDINPFLSESGVPTVRRFPVGFAFGFTSDFNKNRIDLDFSVYNQERESGAVGHKLMGGNIGLRYLRQVYNFDGGDFITLGASASYFMSELEFFDKSESIDLGDPGSFGDLAKLDNNQLYLGPTAGYSFYSQNKEKEVVRLQLTYEINVTESDWSSDYAEVENSINESGNRLRLQLLFPF